MKRMLLGYSPDLDVFDDEPRQAGGDRAAGDAGGSALALEALSTERAAALLDSLHVRRLPTWIARRLSRAAAAAGGDLDEPLKHELVRRLAGLAPRALPVGGPLTPDATARAARLFALELEGLSTEDQEFELARRFAQWTTEAAARAARLPAGLEPARAAQMALASAAQRSAPGWLPPVTAARNPATRSDRITAGGGPRLATAEGARHA